GGLVAGDDQQPDRLGLGAFVVRRRGPRFGDAASVRRFRQEKGAAAGLVSEAKVGRERGQVRTAARAAARPDQDRALAGAKAVAELAALELAAGPRRRSRRDLDVSGGADLDDLGSGAPRLAQPEVDDRRALDDGILAEDDDQLGVADRR